MFDHETTHLAWVTLPKRNPSIGNNGSCSSYPNIYTCLLKCLYFPLQSNHLKTILAIASYLSIAINNHQPVLLPLLLQIWFSSSFALRNNPSRIQNPGIHPFLLLAFPRVSTPQTYYKKSARPLHIITTDHTILA